MIINLFISFANINFLKIISKWILRKKNESQEIMDLF